MCKNFNLRFAKLLKKNHIYFVILAIVNIYTSQMSKNNEMENKEIAELEQLASIAKSAYNSILLLDKEGEIQWANKGFEHMYGYSLEEFRNTFKNENSDFIQRLKDTDKNFFQKNPSLSFSRPFFNKQNQRKWIQSTITPVIDSNNQLERFIVIETDITQQKEVEEELIQRQENTQTLTEHLESVKDYVEEQIQELNQQKKALEQAKEKSEEVLNKVLPYEVAIQLKKKGYAAPRHYKKVTVLHVNIRNFFEMADEVPIEKLVEQLHNGLVVFDGILEEHYVEKIKSSGGTYLGAGGVPLRNRSNPIDAALAALKIKKELVALNNSRQMQQQPLFKTGIALHTGKIIAGVVGKNKLTYDIWGDTVNMAATIERECAEGKITVSEPTYEHIKEFFSCTFQHETVLGTAETIKLYTLERILPEFSEDIHGILPNKTFTQILSKL